MCYIPPTIWVVFEVLLHLVAISPRSSSFLEDNVGSHCIQLPSLLALGEIMSKYCTAANSKSIPLVQLSEGNIHQKKYAVFDIAHIIPR